MSGQLVEQWPLKKLNEICDVSRGKTITRKETVEGDVPVVAGGIISSYSHNTANRPANVITVSGSGANAGFVNFWATPIFASDCSTILPLDPNMLDVRFVYYAMLNLQDYISKELRRGAAQPHVYAKDLALLEIPVPSLEEQQRIVSILDETFEKIGESIKNTEKQSISSLENYRSASKSIFEESGEDWVKTTLGQICTLQRGFDLPRRLRVQGEFPLVSASGVIDTHNIAKVTGPGVSTGRSGTIGKVNYIEDDFWPLNTALYVKDFHGNHPRFIYHFLLEFRLERFAGGTGVPTLNRNLVHPVEVMIPSNIEEQIAITDKLDLLYMETCNYESILNEKQSSLLELKQSILQEAFNGTL